ncbi:MAG: oligopeptide transporter, OPT family [Planctomycetes bacterium]|nr:oligopeptide transporter, OPT family [Planctomycetota bacterium]MBI3846996.1 oligopeptide transporter, OPT family [Planctomycetota bacterium]
MAVETIESRAAANDAAEFKPWVPAEESPPELTFRALLLGAILGIVFGTASTYLALKVGLTTSASVPIAVLAIWAIRRKHGQRAILEHNIVQTTGSAGESVAAAVVFTVPALIFLGYPLHVGLTTLIALTGGLLGVLMMVPLRRYLIVKEHGVLRYPEGKACAEILQAGEKKGASARKVFVGLGWGAGFKAFQAIFGGAKSSLGVDLSTVGGKPFYNGAALGCDFEPSLLGVGYIIGYRTSVMMVAGSVLASLILVPVIIFFGSSLTTPIAPATTLIRDMTPDEVWKSYVKHIGAGAVAAGGIFALIRALPSIGSSLAASAKSLLGGAGLAAAGTKRTDRDTPVPVLVFGALAIVGFIWAVPTFHMNLMGAVLILVLGFLFSVVSSRITGEVGSSSCPLSGMTIGVLMGVCGAFLLVGWEGPAYSRLALMIGAIVCIAISNAGTCSQDLKTGFLVGSTPAKQQISLLVGVLASVLAVGWTAYGLNNVAAEEKPVARAFAVPSSILEAKSEPFTSKADGATYAFVKLGTEELPQGVPAGNYLVDSQTGQAKYLREDGIGNGKLQAPQAKLMSVVIDGLLTHKLPWGLILIGVAIAVFVELMGFRALTFAVGVYLPLSSTMPVFLGGVVRYIADKVYKRTPDAEDESEGTLWGSGLIAGASILGIAAAMQGFIPGFDKDSGLYPPVAIFDKLAKWTTGETHPFGFIISDVFGFLVLCALGWLLFRGAAPPKERA